MAFLNGRIYAQVVVLAFMVGGAMLDGLCAALTRYTPRNLYTSLLAALTPVLLIGSYFITAQFWLSGIEWRIHFWGGTSACRYRKVQHRAAYRI